MSPVALSSIWPALGAAALATFAVTWLLARLAPRLGWVDAGDGGRKIQRQPLPLVGGLAVALGLVVAWTAGGGPSWPGNPLDGLLHDARWRPLSSSAWGPFVLAFPVESIAAIPALAAALLVGLIDDVLPGGLRPRAKLAGQAVAGLVLAWPLLAAGELGLGLALVAGALVAMNALNTYDNADGVASGLTLVALLPSLPVVAAALVAFLPFNLRRADGRAVVLRLPRAILGDAGSHLLGMLILLTPLAWPALALPLLDLARVSVERIRAGQRPWVGDRRHLAHRLEARGLAPLHVAVLLTVVALPSVLLWRLGPAFSIELALLGVALTGVLFALVALFSRAQGPSRGVRRADFGLGA